METPEESRAYARPPFTNEEVFRALAVFVPDLVPEAALEEAKRELPGAPGDPFQGHVTTEVLLVMAAQSDELAARVAAYDPGLAPRVRRVRSDPEAYLRSLRDEVQE